MDRIRQILFVPPAPVVWAMHLGLFARHGVDVETTFTKSSDEMGKGLAAGTWDVGIAVVDNVLAWNEARDAGLEIIAQLERSTIMAFVGLPRLRSLADAAAGAIAVDATTNGFVLVLYRALARAGIDWRACRFDTVGGVRQRYDALVAGTATATILVPPFVDMALEKGFVQLWSGDAIAPDYPGVVATAKRDWLLANEDTARRYLHALDEANQWGGEAANAVAAASALVDAGYAAPAARRLAANVVAGLDVSPQGWDETVALRRECGLLPQPVPQARSVINVVLRGHRESGGHLQK